MTDADAPTENYPHYEMMSWKMASIVDEGLDPSDAGLHADDAGYEFHLAPLSALNLFVSLIPALQSLGLTVEVVAGSEFREEYDQRHQRKRSWEPLHARLDRA